MATFRVVIAMEVLEIKMMEIHSRIVTRKRIGMVKIRLTEVLLNQKRGHLIMAGLYDLFFYYASLYPFYFY